MTDILDQYLAPKPQGDPLDAVIDNDLKAKAMAGLLQAPNPDAAGRANILSRQTGLPAETVQRNLPTIEQDVRARSAGATMDSHPTVATWMANPRNAAVGHDDVDNLAKNAAYWQSYLANQGDLRSGNDPKPWTWGSLATGLWAPVKEYATAIKAGLSNVVADHAPDTPANEYWRRQAMIESQRAEGRVAAATPIIENRVGRAAYSGLQSTAALAPAMVASVLMANPGPVVLYGSAMQGLPAYSKYRARGASPGMAGLGAAGEGGVEAATEALPMSYFVKNLGKVGFGEFVTHLFAKELPTEQIAQHVQDAIDTAIANPDKGWSDYWHERLGVAFDTAIATATQSLVMGAPHAVLRLAGEHDQAQQAHSDATFLDNLANAATESKVRQRDPQAFEQFLDLHSKGTPAENLYVSGDTLRSLMQSGKIDRTDPAQAWIYDYSDQANAAAASGGDVVIPLSQVVARLPGSPVWDEIKDSARLSPGGMSPAEARAFDEHYGDLMKERAQQATEAVSAEAEATAPQQRVHDAIFTQARQAGFTINAARAYADLWSQRYQTRAERLPETYKDAFAAYQAANSSIVQDLPESVGPYSKGDSLDILINAMRKDQGTAKPTDPSLLEWISRNGGIEDAGGDIASMGGDQWHREKPFRKKLIRESGQADALPGMGGGIGEATGYGVDDIAQRAFEAGYFPDRTERPSVDEFLQSVGGELRGQPVYPRLQNERLTETAQQVARAADDLRSYLENRGLDADKAMKAEIEEAIAQREDADRSFEQSAVSAINDVLAAANEAGNRHAVGMIGQVSDWLAETASQFGLEIGGFDHVVDSSAIRHIRKEHGDVAKEESRGQLAITDADLRAIPAVLANPDRIAFGLKGRLGQPLIAYVKTLSDGSTLVIEEVRTGKRHVAIQSMRRYPGTIDATRLAATLDPHARSASQGGRSPTMNTGEPVLDPNAQGDRGAGLHIVDVPEGSKAAELPKRSLFQPSRGRIDFTNDGQAIIRLFENRDMSTLLHEGAGHLWLEELKQDAADPNASEQLKADWQTLVDWWGQHGQHIGEDGEIPTEAHEMFASGMERYFLEGKAPSSALERAFASFRSWLVRIYRAAVNLNAPISDEVRQVMSRLIATDDAINRASETLPPPLFSSAEEAGMGPEEFDAYQKSISQSRTAAFDKLLEQTMATVRKARTAEWREERARVRDEVAKGISGRPEFRALSLMRARDPSERLPLSRHDLMEEYGPDVVAMIPKGVPPTVVDEGGVHPDILAEKVGLATGWELVARLIGIQKRAVELKEAKDSRSPMNEAIDLETDRIMHERHGDILADDSIEEEALAAIHGDTRSSILASELRALARRKGDVPTPWEHAKSWAERIVRDGLVVDQASAAALARHERAEGKAGRAAVKAMLAGDIDEAYRQKQKEMLSHALYRAAKNAKDEVDKIVSRLNRFDRAKTLPSMDQDYLDRIHDLLEAYDFRKRTKRDVAERQSFADWVKAKQEAGEEVYVPPRLADAANVNFSKMTVGDLIGLNDSVQSIAHLGRLKKKILIAQEEREFEEIIDQALFGAEDLPERKFSNDRNPKRSMTRSADAELIKIETLADQLDNGNPNGIFNKILVRGATDAANEKARLQESVLRPLARLYLDMPREQQKRLQQRVEVPEFINPNTGQPTVFSRMELLAVALNTGNASNLDKLLRGEGWTNEGVESVLGRELSKEDWKFVEAIWRQIDTLWPDIARVERELSGVEPERVAARTVNTPYGPIEGGYYPAIYDPTRSQSAADNYEEDAQKLLGQIGRSISTPKGHTVERTDFAAPILLSVEAVLFNHINRVTTRIAYGRYVRDALKFINNGRIRDLINRKAGLEYHSKLKPWLQRQVNEAALNTSEIRWFESLLRHFRINATLVGLGFRWTTMISQVAGLNNSAAVIGSRYLASGMADAVRMHGNASSFVFERSPEMSRRVQERERDTADFFRGIAGRESKLDRARALAFWGIGMIDLHLVSIPTWLGAYRKGIDEGMSEADAAAYGDKAVRLSQGAGRAKDLAAVQGGNEAFRFATMFYSYFNVLYQQQRGVVQDARKGDYRKAAQSVFWIAMAAPLMSAFLTGDWPQKDEDWGEWALRKIFFGLWASIPLARDAANWVERKISGQYAGVPTHPIFTAAQGLMTVGTDAIHAAKGQPVSDQWLKHAIQTPGYFFGLPTGQPANTVQFLHDVGTGNASPRSLDDWYTGLSKGKVDN